MRAIGDISHARQKGGSCMIWNAPEKSIKTNSTLKLHCFWELSMPVLTGNRNRRRFPIRREKHGGINRNKLPWWDSQSFRGSLPWCTSRTLAPAKTKERGMRKLKTTNWNVFKGKIIAAWRCISWWSMTGAKHYESIGLSGRRVNHLPDSQLVERSTFLALVSLYAIRLHL